MAAKIGIVGGGIFGEMHLRAFGQMQREGRAELVGLADLKPDVRERRQKEYGVRTYTDYREMIDKEKPDGISIATPDFLHRQIALEALERGCHVLVEKPMDVTVEGCLEMQKAAREGGLLLQVDFHKRYDPYHHEAFKAIRAGKIGRVQYAYAHMEDKIMVPRDWLASWAPKSSSLWFLGVHMIDLLRWLVGADGLRVWATCNRGKLDALGVKTLDSVQLKVACADGINLSIDTSWILPDGFEGVVNQGFRVVGEDGIIEVDSQDRGSRTATVDEGQATQNLGFFREDIDKQGNPVWRGYGMESIMDFGDNLNAIGQGAPIAELRGIFADAHQGLEVTRIAAAAQESMETGQLVEIER